jgi:peptidoglycan-associated lipoprotein
MLTRFFLILSVLIVVTACSSTDDSVIPGEGDIAARESISTTDGTMVGSEYVDGSQLGGPVPGTQEDLVVNVGDRVLFDYDSSALSSDGRQTLMGQAKWLQQHPNLYVTIEGHCDERGTREYNLALGERRANSARDYLIALGVEPSRINVISYGKERPAVAGSDAESWSQNRRGVTVIR